MSKIGIAILATNAYFVLGIRFIKKFQHHYKGTADITFYFFSDTDPAPYLKGDEDVVYIHDQHKNWADGTNSKFKNIISLKDCKSDYIYYFDADTNISKDFDEGWFLGNFVGGEHFGNRSYLKDGKGFDRYPKSHAYVPVDSKLPYTYRYGAFFGGKKDRVISFCETLREWQLADQAVGYEPPVNDESYINCYFHHHPPYTVPTEKFKFDISDKGGLPETRNVKRNTDKLKEEILRYKDEVFDIRFNKITKY